MTMGSTIWMKATTTMRPSIISVPMCLFLVISLLLLLCSDSDAFVSQPTNSEWTKRKTTTTRVGLNGWSARSSASTLSSSPSPSLMTLFASKDGRNDDNDDNDNNNDDDMGSDGNDANDGKSQAGAVEEIICVAFDGVLANMVDWRIQKSLPIAIKTWPDELSSFATDIESGSVDWLENKMKAVSFCLGATSVSLSDFNPICEYALLARCLLEEQRLDNGRSIGKTGKYASKYHPSVSASESFEEQADWQTTNRRRQRPLTVGEISVNWSEGANLMETLLAKYNVNGKNPLPVLQRQYDDDDHDVVIGSFTTSSSSSIPINRALCKALQKTNARIVVMAQHESDLSVVRSVLPPDLLEKASIVAGSELQIVQHLLATCSSTAAAAASLTEPLSSTRIHCISSHYKALERVQQVLGNDGIVPLVLPGRPLPTSGVLLNLASWAENTHVSQRNDAEMNPWMTLMNEEGFAELLSILQI